MRRLLANSAWLTLGLGAAQVLTAAAYWLSARSSTPAAFGELVAWVGVAMLVSAAADFGFNAWTVREIARTRSPAVFASGLGARLAVAFAVSLVWLAFTAVAWSLGAAPTYVLILGAWLAASLVASILVAPLRALERMTAVSLILSADRALTLAVVGLAATQGAATEGLPIALCAGAVLSIFLSWFALDAAYRRVSSPTLRDVKTLLYGSRGFAYSSFALQAQRLDVALIGIVAGAPTAGIYAAPARLTNALGVIPTAFSGALFPRESQPAEERATRPNELRNSITAVTGLMAIVVSPLFVFAEPLSVRALGDAYAASGTVLRLFLVAIVVATINQPLSVARQARGEEFFVAKVLTIASVAGLVLVGLGAIVHDAVGAAIGIVLAQLIILGLLRLPASGSRRPTSAVSEIPDADF